MLTIGTNAVASVSSTGRCVNENAAWTAGSSPAVTRSYFVMRRDLQTAQFTGFDEAQYVSVPSITSLSIL
jgi:hypothetical protein